MRNVFVYKIYSTFRHPGMKGFFIEDEESPYTSAIFDLESLVYHLRAKLGQLRYDGDRREFHSYLDGYFGRPAVPAEAYLLRKLNKREINDLEKKLDRATTKLPKANCI